MSRFLEGEVGQMARTTGDIKARIGIPSRKAEFDSIPYQGSVMEISEENSRWAKFAGNGYWNDPDMLVTGEQGLSWEEQKVHFALWCIISSPLMLGNDPRHLTQNEKDIILNKDGILINHDPTEQGKRIKVEGDTEIWAKKLKDGKVAVLLLNRNRSENKNITLNFSDIGISQKVKIKDVYAKKDIGSFSRSFSKQIKPRSGLFVLLDAKK